VGQSTLRAWASTRGPDFISLLWRPPSMESGQFKTISKPLLSSLWCKSGFGAERAEEPTGPQALFANQIQGSPVLCRIVTVKASADDVH
jgi:hypothetical protein